MNRRGFIGSSAMVFETVSGCQFGEGRVGVRLEYPVIALLFQAASKMRNRGHHPLCRLLFVATANDVESVITIISVNRIVVESLITITSGRPIVVFDPHEA